MKEILNVILNNLVDNKEDIEIVVTEKENHINFSVKVASTDMGKLLEDKEKQQNQLEHL